MNADIFASETLFMSAAGRVAILVTRPGRKMRKSIGLTVKVIKGQKDIWKFLVSSPLIPDSERPRFEKILADCDGSYAFAQEKMNQLLKQFPILPPLPPGMTGQPPAPGS